MLGTISNLDLACVTGGAQGWLHPEPDPPPSHQSWLHPPEDPPPSHRPWTESLCTGGFWHGCPTKPDDGADK